MSEQTLPEGIDQHISIESMDLTDEQLAAIAGGEFIPNTMRYICDECGTETQCLGANHNYIIIYECPKCHKVYGVW